MSLETLLEAAEFLESRGKGKARGLDFAHGLIVVLHFVLLFFLTFFA